MLNIWVLLLHDNFGNHPEKQNLKHAREILAEIWSGVVIDDHAVLASHIKGDSEYIPEKKSPVWGQSC